jgi:hypothetical protein
MGRAPSRAAQPAVQRAALASRGAFLALDFPFAYVGALRRIPMKKNIQRLLCRLVLAHVTSCVVFPSLKK